MLDYTGKRDVHKQRTGLFGITKSLEKSDSFAMIRRLTGIMRCERFLEFAFNTGLLGVLIHNRWNNTFVTGTFLIIAYIPGSVQLIQFEVELEL